MKTKIFLGKTSKEFNMPDENLYLYKHSWDCGWYWGFGYIGNENLHMHIPSLIESPIHDVNVIFNKTKITQSEWWVIRDLFIQAYALKKVAEVYRYGGHQTTKPGIVDILKNSEKADMLNNDLELVLDKVWSFLLDIDNH